MEYEKLYTVEDIAQMTMLTTRTIRNYLKDGLLTGKKIGGQWRFTQKDIEALFSSSTMNTDMSNSRRQEVMDFMDGINTDMDGTIQICTIVDYYCPDTTIAKRLSDSYCNIISNLQVNTQHKYYFEYIDKEQKARYTFMGSPAFIKDAVTIAEQEWNRIKDI